MDGRETVKEGKERSWGMAKRGAEDHSQQGGRKDAVKEIVQWGSTVPPDVDAL